MHQLAVTLKSQAQVRSAGAVFQFAGHELIFIPVLSARNFAGAQSRSIRTSLTNQNFPAFGIGGGNLERNPAVRLKVLYLRIFQVAAVGDAFDFKTAAGTISFFCAGDFKKPFGLDFTPVRIVIADAIRKAFTRFEKIWVINMSPLSL